MSQAAANSAISEAQVRHIAKLARLAMGEGEVARYTHELAAILGYVEQLKQVNIDGVEPMAHALPQENVWRADEPLPPLGVDAALQNAPEREGPFFKLPKVLGDDSA
jgi:aspartyl-tRNA(Asn)/glutamyl-tRNA(Gln) amidotransferase subunit C